MSRSFRFALLLSLIVHGLTLISADIALPGTPVPLPPLQAFMAPPRLPEIRRPDISEQAKPTPEKSNIPATTAPPVEKPRAAAESPASVSPPPAAAEPPPPAKQAISLAHPPRGSIRFALYYEENRSESLTGIQGDSGGKHRWEVGAATHEWNFAGEYYVLKATTQRTGIIGRLRPDVVEMESLGDVTSLGLQPRRFTSRRNGQETRESAEFNWQRQQLTLGNGAVFNDVKLGAQDLISFYYQLGYLPDLASGANISVTTGKKFEGYRFEWMGEEDLNLPSGKFHAIHLRVQTDNTIDLWLAEDFYRLPVKIRFVGRKGETFEQIAVDMGTQQKE